MKKSVMVKTIKPYEMSNKALRGAWRRGWLAYQYGDPFGMCPYSDKRGTKNKHVTWSRAFIRAWQLGWSAACAQRHALRVKKYKVGRGQGPGRARTQRKKKGAEGRNVENE
jgi:hypothetical protein